jgi:hypothetical protein
MMMISFNVHIYPNLKVTEMKAEYFPPKEDVVLENEAPTDFYIFVTGGAVRTMLPFICEDMLLYRSFIATTSC